MLAAPCGWRESFGELTEVGTRIRPELDGRQLHTVLYPNTVAYVRSELRTQQLVG
jgi:hypothetical protein